MKFDAAAMTPGRAKRYQNGTLPSAKSIQAVPVSGRPQGPAAAAGAGRAAAAMQATAMTPARTTLLTGPSLATDFGPAGGYRAGDERAPDEHRAELVRLATRAETG